MTLDQTSVHRFLNLLLHFCIAILATFVLASLAHSQFVLHELASLGVTIDVATRISSSLDDLSGLLPGYGGILAVGLLIGFSIMGLLRKYRPAVGYWVYPVGGLITVLVAHLAMHPIFNVTLIAGARTPLGLLCQALAGLIGGYVFMQLRRPRQ